MKITNQEEEGLPRKNEDKKAHFSHTKSKATTKYKTTTVKKSKIKERLQSLQ